MPRMMAILLWRTFILLLLPVHHCTGTFIQQELTFQTEQAQQLWDQPHILGNTTHFDFPVSMGTTSACDEELQSLIFTSGFDLNSNYTRWEDSWEDDIDVLSSLVYMRGFSFQSNMSDLVIAGETVTLKGCIQACITLKHFVCRELDFYHGESNICYLFHTNGQFQDVNGTNYVGINPASDHYVIRELGQEYQCNDTQPLAHPHFALGWKALEAGWYDLSRDQFKKALEIDRNYYIAAIGLILSNENMGYGLTDEVLGSYKDKLLEISESKDKDLKLTEQYMLILHALVGLHSDQSLNVGLKVMARHLSIDTTTRKNDLVNVVAGNTNLLAYNSPDQLSSISPTSLFALHYLTHRLNPYKNGQNKPDVAIQAVYNFSSLRITGSWQIISDCIDIAEYYSKWSLAMELINIQRRFLATNTGQLLREEKGYVLVNGLNFTYASISEKRVNQYERHHFYMLQLGLFNEAKSYANDLRLKAKDEELRNILFRMTANAFFTTYGYVYDNYAQDIYFEEDWKASLDSSSSEIGLTSRVYYWTAAAVQSLLSSTNEENGADIYTDVKKSADLVRQRIKSPQYHNLVAMYQSVAFGIRYKEQGYYNITLVGLLDAGRLNEIVSTTKDWSVSGSSESHYYKPLLHLGFQFRADMMNSLDFSCERGNYKIKLSNVTAAYKIALNAAPLSQSRLLLGYGSHAAARGGSVSPDQSQTLNKLLGVWKGSDASARAFTCKYDIEHALNCYKTGKTQRILQCPQPQVTGSSCRHNVISLALLSLCLLYVTSN